MTITDAKYTDASKDRVSALIEGQPVTFPADPQNRHYAALLRSGVEIAPAAPEAT